MVHRLVCLKTIWCILSLARMLGVLSFELDFRKWSCTQLNIRLLSVFLLRKD